MPKMIVVFESRTGNTRKIAEKLAEAVKAHGIEVVVKHGREAEISDLDKADAVAMGGATYHHDLIPSMKEFLFKTEHAKLKGKVGLAFGSYGWSGDGIDVIHETMLHLHKMKMLEPLKVNAWKEQEGLAKIDGLAEKIASGLRAG